MPVTRKWKKSEVRAAWKMMCGAVMISFSSVWVKLAHVSPTVSGFYRVFIGALVLLAIVGVRRERLWGGWPYLALAIAAGLLFALDLFVWHRSVLLIGPGLATILPNFQVFLLALFGVVVLGEKPDIRFFLALPMAVAGLFLVVGIGWDQLLHVEKTGIAFGLIAAVLYAGYNLLLRRLQTHPGATSPAACLAVVSILAAGFLWAAAAMEHQTFVIPDRQSFLALAALGIFSQVIGWVLITSALPVIRASLAGLLLLLQPTLAFAWDVLFFHRPTTAVTLAGVAITLSAIYLGLLGSTSRSTTPKSDARPQS